MLRQAWIIPCALHVLSHLREMFNLAKALARHRGASTQHDGDFYLHTLLVCHCHAGTLSDQRQKAPVLSFCRNDHADPPASHLIIQSK